MKKITMFGILGLFVLALTLQSVSAYNYYNYDPYYNRAVFYVGANEPDYYRYDSGYYWDYEDLEWKKDKVLEWIEKGDGWREEYKRARAVTWLADSYDRRYNLAHGQETGNVYYRTYDPDYYNKPASSWRYKTAYDPRIHGQGSNDVSYYYYKPRYDPELGYYNWRY